MLAVRWKTASALMLRGLVRAQHARQNFFRRLHQALGPARLLRLEGVHFHGQLGGAFDVRQVEKFPAEELRAVGEIGVLGERVVLPAAGFVDRAAAPHAGGAVEIEEAAAARARAVLHDEVAVEQDRFDFGQRGVMAVQVGPAPLDHADFGIGEIGQRAAQKIGRGQEIGVEDGDEFAGRGFQSLGQRAGLVAGAVGAMQIVDRQARAPGSARRRRARLAASRRWNRRAPECRAVRADNRSARRRPPGARSRSARCRSEAVW